MDQNRCRPAPGTIGQVSARPLQRIMPSSHVRPKLGSVSYEVVSSAMPISSSTWHAISCSSWERRAGVCQMSHGPRDRAVSRLAAMSARIEREAQSESLTDSRKWTRKLSGGVALMRYDGQLCCKQAEALVNSTLFQVQQRSFCNEQSETVHVTPM
jgi:hypothetical protein